MRVNAYVLAADPSFLAESIRAYYDRVARIVVSFDRDSTSWRGTALPVEECLGIIRSLDVDGKCVFSAGHYARGGEPLVDETYQRQTALDEAAQDADWVLQLDTDEVMLDPGAFFRSLQHGEDAGAAALDYPARWLYARVGPGRYLEASTRFGRPSATYPGPLAVRSGTTLRFCRQADATLYRVDLRPWNTDPFHPRAAVVHEVVEPAEAVLHFSWVRPDETMRRKFAWSGHAEDYTRPVVYRRWVRRARYPRTTALTSPFRRFDPFRLVTVAEPPGGQP
ncbi:hypothetical protein [Pengzhenrongella frigida]|uniref:hypothetical protein n=1 Tax=Pengzhenrongella frigida TaxID=1259133 RepID=UPI0013E9C57B|nr:hypothetical protein [Cellulomonas sp. HLT2-17]